MEELYREYSKIVYRFLLSLCRDAQLAEELTQETFLQAFLSLERFDGSCKLSVWLCQIARHLFYQHLRKTGREVPTEQSRIPESVAADNTERAAVTKLELMDVLKEVQKLPPQMREVIYLRVMGQLSFREIGEIVGKSENWARVTFYRGKEQLLLKRREWERE
ncbi:MAG: sigma-70 family RNA polymerase sigma factor [Lachnospiraceae bacterium]|nr:sigma-70 family RNA polymerase sigma factor [Lachnospiraceae bacterium]